MSIASGRFGAGILLLFVLIIMSASSHYRAASPDIISESGWA